MPLPSGQTPPAFMPCYHPTTAHWKKTFPGIPSYIFSSLIRRHHPNLPVASSGPASIMCPEIFPSPITDASPNPSHGCRSPASPHAEISFSSRIARSPPASSPGKRHLLRLLSKPVCDEISPDLRRLGGLRRRQCPAAAIFGEEGKHRSWGLQCNLTFF